MPQKKILNVVSVYFSMPFFFGEQLSHFTKKGYEIHLVCSPNKSAQDFANSHGCKCEEIQIERKISPISDLKALLKLIKYLRKEKFDIVCGHTPKGGLLAMLASFFVRVPKRVFFRHGLIYETASGIKRKIFILIERITSWCATDVVCVSPYLIERSGKDKLTKRKKMLLLNQGSCNGVDALGQFNPLHIDKEQLLKYKQDLGLNGDEFVIGYTGRLVTDKGIVELVEAFERLKDNRNNIKLLLVGPYEERDAVPYETKTIIESDKDIIHTGEVEPKIIQYYYSLMNLLVLCTHREGFGTSILEASSMGIPVLTTSHTGSRDAIKEGVTGQYVETNADSLVLVLSSYLDSPSLCEEQGKQGRKFVLDNFEKHIIWDEIENKIYK